MKETDIVVVPSIWNETFGFNVIEALSYATPCIVTENVGAKDIIENSKSGFIIKDDIEELKNILLKVINEKEILQEMNEYILLNIKVQTMEEHTKKILEFYEV